MSMEARARKGSGPRSVTSPRPAGRTSPARLSMRGPPQGRRSCGKPRPRSSEPGRLRLSPTRSALLAPGLQTFAVQAGLAPLNWGSVSNDYGKVAGTALYRRGLTPKLTVEGSVEGSPGTVMAGAGGVAQIGNLGVINFAAAVSTGSGNLGGQFSVGAQRIGRVFSLGSSAMIANRNYRDVASMNGDGVLRKQLSAFTSLSLRRFGTVGAAYGGVDQDAAPTSTQLDVMRAEHSQRKRHYPFATQKSNERFSHSNATIESATAHILPGFGSRAIAAPGEAVPARWRSCVPSGLAPAENRTESSSLPVPSWRVLPV
jgi:hypothetical protein